MTYIRKIIALLLAIIFCVALVVGIGVIFAVKNVNVEYVDFSGGNEESYLRTKENLNKLKGSSMLFVGDGDIADKVSDKSVIAVQSYEKIFPCTINVVIKERVEKFAFKVNEGYAMYDSDGEYMRTVNKNENRLDDSPNVEIVAQSSQVKDVARACAVFSAEENFGSLRNIVKTVGVSAGMTESLNTLTFTLYCGLVIQIVDWSNMTAEKISEAYKTYSGLSESQRLRGSVTAIARTGETAVIVAEYFAN